MPLTALRAGLRARWLARLGAVALLPAASAVTYREWVDGPLGPFALAQLASLLAAALVTLWWTSSPRPLYADWIGVALAVLVALPAPAVHATRLLNRRAEVGGALGPPVEYGRVLAPVLQGEGTFRVTPDALELRAPAGSTAFVELHRAGDPDAAWRLPYALVSPAHARQWEEVVWRAAVERENSYFVLAEAGPVLVQLTTSGLLVTAPVAGGDVRAHNVPLALAGGQVVEWSVRRAGGRVQLTADGREVWSGADAGPFDPVRLGESRADRDHGGWLRLTSLRYRRSAV